MTLDAEVRALERVARARPDDGAAQVGFAAALVRMGRPREALEAFIRAASAEPGDPEVVRALRDTSWWTGPRGPGGGTRHVPVPGLRRRPDLVVARRLGQAGAGLAVGGGIVFARVAEEASDTRLVALALATGRELWSREETVAAAAPPVYSDDGTVLDAALVDSSGATVFRIRARDAATGADRWVRTSELTDVQPGATFLGACVSGRYAAFAIKPHGKKTFEPLVRVVDAGRGDDVEKLSLRGLEDAALERDQLAFATGQDVRRVELRHLPQSVRVWTSAMEDPPKRIIVAGSNVVVATDRGLAAYDRGQRLLWRQERRGLYNDEALVVTPRLIVASWQRAATSALALESGDFLWADEPMARMLSAAEDTLYAVTRDQAVRGIDLATGEALWQVELSGLSRELDGATVHKLGVAHSRVVGLTKEGVLFVLA